MVRVIRGRRLGAPAADVRCNLARANSLATRRTAFVFARPPFFAATARLLPLGGAAFAFTGFASRRNSIMHEPAGDAQEIPLPFRLRHLGPQDRGYSRRPAL